MRFALVSVMIAFSIGAAHAQEEECKTLSFSRNCKFVLGQLNDGKIEADDLKIEFNSPTVPAGAIIGADDLALSTVRTFSDFTPQLLAGFNDNMELQPGLAIGGAPYWWFEPKETLEEYRSGDLLPRILKRTQFGLATKQETAETAGASNRVLVGVSLGWQLFDDQDVRSNHFRKAAECVYGQTEIILAAIIPAQNEKELQISLIVFRQHRNSFNEAARKAGLPNPETLTEEWLVSAEGQSKFHDIAEQEPVDTIVDELDSKIGREVKGTDEQVAAFKNAQEECEGDFTQKLSESPSLSLNVAAGMASDTGKFDNLAGERTSIWLTYNSGTPSSDASRRTDPDYKEPFHVFGAPVIGFLNYNFDEKVTLPNDTKVEADRLILGIGTSFKRGEDEAFDFQASFIRTDFDTNMPRSNDYRVTLSYSRKVSDNLWLEAKAGTTNSDELEDATFAGISLKVDWAALWRSRQ